MENRASWAPRTVLSVIAWMASAAFAAIVVVLLLGGDPVGALLFAVATVAAVAFGCYTTFRRPRLAADANGLTVRTFGGTHAFTWNEARATVVTTRRLGRDVRTLEIDTGEQAPHLIVFGRLELDEDPDDVLETLNGLRPAL